MATQDRREYMRNKVRLRRAELTRQGRCNWCGNKLGRLKRLCDACGDKHNQRQNASNARKRGQA